MSLLLASFAWKNGGGDTAVLQEGAQPDIAMVDEKSAPCWLIDMDSTRGLVGKCHPDLRVSHIHQWSLLGKHAVIITKAN